MSQRPSEESLLLICHNCALLDVKTLQCKASKKPFREQIESGRCPENYFNVPAAAPKREPVPAAPPAPVPRVLWPDHICFIGDARDLDDKGVGDTCMRFANRSGVVPLLRMAIKKAFKECGCNQHQEVLNAKYSY